MIDDQKILDGVRQCICKTLDDEREDIRPEHRLIGDIGLDSLDLMHLIFTMEQHFGIRISPRDIEKRAREKLGAVPFEIDGTYTPEGLAELRLAMPEIPPEELSDELGAAELPRHFRVATMQRLVKRFMEEQNA